MAQNTIQARKEILRLEDRWREAQHQNDKDAYDQLLSADLTFIGTSGSFGTKPASSPAERIAGFLALIRTPIPR